MDPTERVDEIMGRWREDAEQGRLVDPKSVLESHPEYAGELADRFAAQALVDEFFADADGLPLFTPERIGDYLIVGEIGRGGMGVVYEAMQESMRRRVALKVLYPTIATTVRTRKRFEREARITGRLHHSNVVTVYSMGREAGNVYFAMELIDGRPLSDAIEHLRAAERGEATSQQMQAVAEDLRGRGYHQRIASKFAGVADALHVAHAHGVIHRDVKPSNLVLDTEGELKLTDFGLAQLVGEELGITRTGEVLGTPLYMSPEQVRARREQIDLRTDVYSLGATLYELLTLRAVHPGADVGTLCSQILTQEPRPLLSFSPDTPKDLATIVHKALQKDRRDRYASAGDMAADLRAFAEGREISARPLALMTRAWRRVKRHKVRSALVVLVLIASAAAIYMESRSRAEEGRRLALQYASVLQRADAASGFASGPRAVAHAEKLYEEAIALQPERPDAWFARAIALNRGASARLADIREAETRGMPPKSVHLARAYIYRGQQRLDAAGEAERRASEAQGDTPATRFLEGLLARQSGDSPRALEIFEALIETDRLSARLKQMTLRHMAQIQDQAGRFERAIEHLSAAYPGNRLPIPAAVHIAALWRKQGSEQTAERRFQMVLDQMAPSSTTHEWAALCETAERFGSNAWIRRGAEAGLTQHPDDPNLHYYHALGLWGEGRADEALEVATKALTTWNEVHQLHAVHGRIRLGRGENEAAVAAFERAIELNPGVVGPRFDYAMALLRLGKPDEALRACREGHALDPAYAFGYEMEARIHRSRGDLSAAIAALTKCMEIVPRGVRPRLALASALERTGKRDAALEVLAEGLRREPNELQMRLDRIHMLGRARRPDARRAESEAFLASVRELLKVTPKDPNLHRRHGLALNLLGKNVEAVAAFDEAIRLGRDDGPTWHDRGLMLIKLGKLEAAQASIEKAVERSPAFAEAYSSLGHVLSGQGRYEEALTAIRTSLSHARSSYLVGVNRYNLARTLKLLGRFDEAEAAYHEAIKSFPKDGSCWTGLADCYVKQRKLDEAVKAFDKAKEVAPRNSHGWWGAADVRGKQGKTDEALGVLEKGLALHAGNSFLLNLRGVLLREADRFEEAKAAYRPFLKDDPAYAWAWSGMAAVLKAVDEDKGAVTHYDKAIALDPKNIGTLYNRAMMHSKMDKHDAALRDLEAGLELSAGHPFRPLFEGSLAWTLTSCKDAALRDAGRALELSKAAVAAEPNEALGWCALGWARLRTQKDPNAAIEAFTKARDLAAEGDEDLGACYGLAIALTRSDKADGAAMWLEKARTFARDHARDAQQVEHLRLEAKAALDLQRR